MWWILLRGTTETALVSFASEIMATFTGFAISFLYKICVYIHDLSWLCIMNKYRFKTICCFVLKSYTVCCSLVWILNRRRVCLFGHFVVVLLFRMFQQLEDLPDVKYISFIHAYLVHTSILFGQVFFSSLYYQHNMYWLFANIQAT